MNSHGYIIMFLILYLVGLAAGIIVPLICYAARPHQKQGGIILTQSTRSMSLLQTVILLKTRARTGQSQGRMVNKQKTPDVPGFTLVC